MKKVLKFSALLMIYTVLFTVSSALLPYSESFKAANVNSDPAALVFMLLSNAWLCSTAVYIAAKSKASAKKTVLFAILSLFGIGQFMTQIETLFFLDAFPVLTALDGWLIMLSGLIPLLVVVPLAIKFFGTKPSEPFVPRVDVKKLCLMLGLAGLLYAVIYFLFGYFVAWQSADLRLFYSGSVNDLGFMGQLANNLNTNPIIYPFQFMRGILFAGFAVPLLFLFDKKREFILSCLLVYLTTAVVLLIPNILFPDTVRIQHLYEMASSMLVFGMIAGTLLWKVRNKTDETIATKQ